MFHNIELLPHSDVGIRKIKLRIIALVSRERAILLLALLTKTQRKGYEAMEGLVNPL